MTTDLSRMILAARQIGEVVGEDILDGLVFGNDPPSDDAPDGFTTVGMRCVLPAPEGGYYTTIHILPDADALDLLTARVWRAVQGWALSWSWQDNWIFLMAPGGGEFSHPDLPSAVAAIHKHWQENRNA